MLPAVHDAIVRAARENGLEPSMALAIADRESSGDVNGRAPGSSAFGLFQMLRSERNAYGGNSTDPHEQATAWAHYIKGTQAEMARVLGRQPTGPETYGGHYWGGTRAARIISGQIPGQTPVSAVFSPQELAVNPNIARAGTTGALSSSVMADIARRQGKYADAGSADKSVDPEKWGTLVGPDTDAPSAPSGPPPMAPVPTGNFDSAPAPKLTQPPASAPSQAAPAQIPPPMSSPGTPVPYTSGQSIV